MENKGTINTISQIRTYSHEFIIKELKKLGEEHMVPSHGEILINLYKHGTLSMKKIAQMIQRKKNTVTILATKLVDLGYIHKTTDPADSRITLLSLTQKGKEFYPQFIDISDRLNNKIFNGITKNEQKELQILLSRIHTNLQE